jgi:uncharacterized protein (DUF885 family)
MRSLQRRLRVSIAAAIAATAALLGPWPAHARHDVSAQKTVGGSPSTTATDVDRLAAAVTRLADAYVEEFSAHFPDEAELRGLSAVQHNALTDNSLDALHGWQQLEDRWANEIRAFNLTALQGRPEWVTLGFLEEAIESSRGERLCRNELWPVNQLRGWQVQMARLAAAQPVGNDKARADALMRWGKLPRYLETEVRNLREGVRESYTTPKRNVQLVIGQLDNLLAKRVEEWPFYSPAQRDVSETFRRDWVNLLTSQIRPAIQRYRTYLQDEYLARAREPLAIVANPQGRACYQASFRAQTTLRRPANETFELGRREVAKNLAAALDVGHQHLGAPDLQTLLARIRDDRANRFETRDARLNFARDAVARARTKLGQWFATTPGADVIVEPYPSFLEREMSDSYWPAAEDGSRPAKYQIKLYGFAEATRSDAEITAFHETYPGHHLQIGLARELAAAPPITRLVGNSGFTEGWARYAEALAEEMGLYSSDYARASRRLWPARGMVVDPGLHLFGWTRGQAVDFIVAGGRSSREAAEVLVDRIAVSPAQLTAYDTGALEFFGLREQARKALGERFDIREFHAVVLANGTVTLPMLREQVRTWLASKPVSLSRDDLTPRPPRRL